MLCLRCGLREQFADNMCEECLMDAVRPLEIPQVIHGNVCPTCNRIQKGRSWSECTGNTHDAAVDLAGSNLTVHVDANHPIIEFSVEHHDNNLFKILGDARTTYKGVIIHQELRTEVRISLLQCPWCSKQHGNYFEAILQIRGLEGISDEEIDILLNRIRDDTFRTGLKDPNVFISKEEVVKGGYDFYMGEHSYTRQLSQKLHETYGGEHKWSSSLFGRREGKDIYRHTFLVRLPGFVQGDYLLKEGEPMKVTKIQKRVTARSLRTGRDIHMDQSEAMALVKRKRADVEVDLVVVSQSANEVQVLHPTTMLTVDLLKGPQTVVGETVKGALVDGELYLV